MTGLKASDLDAAARNPDGTYDGARALSWLSEVLHPGGGVPVKDVIEMWDDARAARKAATPPAPPPAVNAGFGVPYQDNTPGLAPFAPASAPIGVVQELEPQAHGGALLRRHALEDDEGEQRTMETRHDERMALVPALYKTMHERLACELAMAPAMGETQADVFERYDHGPVAAAQLMAIPQFASLLERVTKEVREQGLTFRAKARIIAEDLLPVAYDMATDPLISSAVRQSTIQWMAKMGALEPKEKGEVGTGGGLNLSITFAGQAPVQVVAHQPLTIDQEAG